MPPVPVSLGAGLLICVSPGRNPGSDGAPGLAAAALIVRTPGKFGAGAIR